MFGDLARQQEFGTRHKLLIENATHLKSLIDTLLSNCDKSTYAAMALYTLARVAIEDDFWSVVLLCANGFPHSARQILRGMFERVVTFSYLVRHPDEIKLFTDFFWVDRHKRLSKYERHSPGKFSVEAVEEAKTKFEEIKANYEMTDCRKCKTKRVNLMWSKKSLIDMATEVGISHDTIDVAYYGGIEEAHPKIDALFTRTKEEANGSVSYNEQPGVDEADLTMLTTNVLQLKVLEVFRDYFKIPETEHLFGLYLQGLSNYIRSIREQMAIKTSIPESQR